MILIPTVFSAFEATASQYSERPFLHVPASACRRYSDSAIEQLYGETLSRVLTLSSAYVRAGYGPGQRVGLVLENRPRFFEHFLALNRVGASVVPISAELRAEELRYLVTHSAVALIAALPEYLGYVNDVRSAIDNPPSIVVDGPDVFQHLPEPNGPPRNSAADDEAALVYTSGTTARPKGCMLSNAYFLECGRWYLAQGGLCAMELGRERLITPLPLNHSNALAWSFTAMVRSGGTLVQLDRFRTEDWWDAVRLSRATIIHYLGVMPAMLLKCVPTPADNVGAQVKFGFGAGVDPRNHEAFEARFGFPLIEAWATTETGAAAVIAANSPPRRVGTRCFGRSDPSIEHRLVDEAGCDVPRGVPGELLVRRRGADPRRFFFSGYHGDPAATAEVWEGDWFHTGDVVREDEDGLLYFVDRRKNIIRRSGENIAAVEVEGALLRHSAVRSCAAAPVQDDLRGEEVFACIILQDGAQPSAALAAELCEFCRPLLAYFKLPGYIAFVDSLPLTGSQKIQRAQLKELAGTLLAQGGAFNLTAQKKRRGGAHDGG